MLGGLVAQEVIKILTLKDAPLQNWLFFDGSTGAGVVQKLP